ncbi:hypothetical protein Vretifemale_10692 [Volvox reticuliferus]|uniref:Uncharacterized protein n=1 Tax=Volvox reticuliferus TaxID=1737510 RepID=A0A8J4CFH9_9CHLO|nr:hypothetical protein Vretifemale_10692 [Volvox reticuliferus]
MTCITEGILVHHGSAAVQGSPIWSHAKFCATTSSFGFVRAFTIRSREVLASREVLSVVVRVSVRLLQNTQAAMTGSDLSPETKEEMARLLMGRSFDSLKPHEKGAVVGAAR